MIPISILEVRIIANTGNTRANSTVKLPRSPLREYFRVDGKRVIVQGLGNVGYHAAKFLNEKDGSKIKGIVKQDGGLSDVEGLNVEAVRTWFIENGGVSGYPDARNQENGAAVMEEECDILISAALEVIINLSNAVRIKAPLIIEGANGLSRWAQMRSFARKGQSSSPSCIQMSAV